MLFKQNKFAGFFIHEKISLDAVERTSQTQMWINVMKRNGYISAIAYTCMDKSIVFLRDGNRRIINQNTIEPRSHIGVQNVGSTGSPGPDRPAAWTESDDFVSWRLPLTSTWMRPLP